MRPDNLNIRVKPAVRQFWKVAAACDGYTSFSEFVRVAIAEKVQRSKDERSARQKALETALSREA